MAGAMNIAYEESFSDNDEEDMLALANFLIPPRPKTFRPRIDHYTFWDDYDFFVRFRLSKMSVYALLLKIENQLEHPTDKNKAINPMTQLLLTLRFYFLGSMIISVADFIGVHKSTACKAIHRVTRAITGLAPEYIKFPDTVVGMQAMKNDVYNIARFPRCIGVIDCTHIKIQSSGGNRAEYFRNRKSFFSLNVQTISDAKVKILDIVASWPGSTHDTSIFNGSAIKARFEEGEMGESVLVGDGGYPILPYLITPLENPVSRKEILFNEAQIRTRNPVERKYGIWKRRFPILSSGMRMKLPMVMATIIATAVLHNIAVESGEAELPIDPLVGDINLEDDEMPEIIERNFVAVGNNRVRQGLIQYFANLP